jgi:hypothetical protein
MADQRKAQLTMGTPIGPSYLGFLALGTAAAGIILFSLIGSGCGREYVDRTVKDAPGAAHASFCDCVRQVSPDRGWSDIDRHDVSHRSGGWDSCGLPTGASTSHLARRSHPGGNGALDSCAATPIIFFASAGHGYLPPSGLPCSPCLAQVVGIIGWGNISPGQSQGLCPDGELGLASYVMVVITCLIGLAATFAWWELADQK